MTLTDAGVRSVWLPSAPCTPGTCVERTGSVAAVPRAMLRLTAVVALLVVGVAFCPVGGRIPSRVVRPWARGVARAAGRFVSGWRGHGHRFGGSARHGGRGGGSRQLAATSL